MIVGEIELGGSVQCDCCNTKCEKIDTIRTIYEVPDKEYWLTKDSKHYCPNCFEYNKESEIVHFKKIL